VKQSIARELKTDPFALDLQRFPPGRIEPKAVQAPAAVAEDPVETAARHFSGADDLVLVAVEAPALGAALRWEPSRGGDLFPHLYAPLPLAAVRWVRPLPLGADGQHVFPEFDG
jgi:uncharacterized protein (DUF952 family)